MKPTYEEMIEALEDMARQYLEDIDGEKLSHDFMSAGENCLDVLEKAGKVKTEDEINYQWVKNI